MAKTEANCKMYPKILWTLVCMKACDRSELSVGE
uniref:Uncharacterized protein n=1 Tax=Anguilla anguilla TaxID=7936 RepID=A0A0E9UK40_ANGAN